MIFYTRHNDERCFYYRISRKPGDITTLGEEKQIAATHNTTYPSPFILENDPSNIYLLWRGIGWHPTIARLTLPDENDNVQYNWGAKQIVQGTAARPYAKYFSNGKDKIYLAYTLGHPDVENPNWLYFNFINITGSDADKITLTDVKGKHLSTIADGAHNVSIQDSYLAAHPDAVANHDAMRNWIWQVSKEPSGAPVIAMTQINDAKTSHDYYHVRWTGEKWQKTFLANGGGHFHQTPNLEMCYSGGMAIDDANPDIVYCSTPVWGRSGKVYEIIKYAVNTNDGSVVAEAITRNSRKNNVRPYIITNSENSPLRLLWMHGEYYDWIVSSRFPKGYPTAIRTNFRFPQSNNIADAVTSFDNITGDFTVVLSLRFNTDDYNGTIVQIGNLKYGVNGETMKPYVEINNATFNSTNRIGNSDVWKTQPRATNGRWHEPLKPEFLNVALVYENGGLKTYLNGLLDQHIDIPNLKFQEMITSDFKGAVENSAVYDKALSQYAINRVINSMLN